MVGLAYLCVDADLASTAEVSPRLRDLISGLWSGDIAAASVVSQLDPDFCDEIRALVAHRGINLEMFLANVLLAFALDIADETWSRVVQRKESLGKNGEAVALSDLLTVAMHQMLQRGLRLRGETAGEARRRVG
jgi:hypothetical protein